MRAFIRRYFRTRRKGHVVPKGMVEIHFDNFNDNTADLYWSFCDPEDSFSYKESLRVAQERGAVKFNPNDGNSVQELAQKLPFSIVPTFFDVMHDFTFRRWSAEGIKRES